MNLFYEGNTFDKMGEYISEYGFKILFVVCIIVIGIIITWFLSFLMKKLLLKTRIDGAVVSFITAIFKIFMLVIIVLVCASVLELSTSSLIISLSSLAIAVGLALKDSFSNLANGILIIMNKPFKRGNYVSINGIEGKVHNIKLLTVELITFDNVKIVLPNNSVLNGNIINYSALAIRRVDMEFTVAYGSNMNLVEEVLNDVCLEHPKILNSMKANIYMKSHSDSSIVYMVKAWVNNSDYFDVLYSLPRLVYDAFNEAHIEIPFNQLDVHVKKD